MKFCKVIYEFESFVSQCKVNDNIWIFSIQYYLGIEHSNNCQNNAEKYELYTAGNTAQFTLRSDIDHFQNTVKNPNSKSSIKPASIAL